MREMAIRITGLTKRLGDVIAVDGVDLDIEPGELIALLGPSGSGKTTLLRLIAGLETADAGDVMFDGSSIGERDIGERGVGFVFQHYALFRSMTVFDNVAFGLRVRPRRRRPSRADIRRRVLDLLEMVQLDGLAARRPSELSGGQLQRVALARALAVEPRVLLLDEPFGALDAGVRQDLRRRLRELHNDLRITTVLVTHDREEALELADRVVVLNKGRIEQAGTPEEVYDQPVNRFVLNFMGFANQWQAHGARYGHRGETGMDTGTGYVRPHDVLVARHPTASSIRARVLDARPLGSIARLVLEREDSRESLHVELTRDQFRELELVKGTWVYVSAEKLRFFGEPASMPDLWPAAAPGELIRTR